MVKMVSRNRDEQSGKFVQKSEQKRKVRSVRLTDNTFNYLNKKAQENNQTIADLLEQIYENKTLENNQSNYTNSEILITRSKKLVYDESLIRSRDRSPVKKLLSKLFNIDKKYYDRTK